jgi:hypothetical protein
MAPPLERVSGPPVRNPVLGTTPIDATTRSAGNSEPSTRTARGPAGPRRISSTFLPSRTSIPCSLHVLGDQGRLLVVQGEREIPALANQERDVESAVVQDLCDLDADEAAPDDHRPFALLGAPVEPFEVAERNEVVEAGPLGSRPRSAPGLRADREEDLVVGETPPVVEGESMACRVERRDPAPDPLEPHPVVKLAIVRLGVLQTCLACEDVHQRRAGRRSDRARRRRG